MASNEFSLSEKSKQNDFDFILKKIDKFWILKTRDTAKRLTFLNNAEDVVVEENILIADDQLFEIHKGEDGDFSFWRLEDLTYEPNSRGKKTDSRQQNRRQVKSSYYEKSTDELFPVIKEQSVEETYPEHTYYEIKEDVCTKMQAAADSNSESKINISTEHSREIIHLKTTRDYSTGTEQVMSDIYHGSTEYFGCDLEQHEKCDSFALSSTEMDSVTKTANIASKLSSTPEANSKLPQLDDAHVSRSASTGTERSKHPFRPSVPVPKQEIRDLVQEFEVEVKPSDLAKLCSIEGKMILIVRNNDMSFEDPTTTRVRYGFQLPWIKEFGQHKSHLFRFTVGRKCPNGIGSIYCLTPYAKIIKELVSQKCREISKTRATSQGEKDCKHKP